MTKATPTTREADDECNQRKGTAFDHALDQVVADEGSRGPGVQEGSSHQGISGGWATMKPNSRGVGVTIHQESTIHEVGPSLGDEVATGSNGR